MSLVCKGEVDPTEYAHLTQKERMFVRYPIGDNSVIGAGSVIVKAVPEIGHVTFEFPFLRQL